MTSKSMNPIEVYRNFFFVVICYTFILGELSGQGAELLLRFHTSKEERTRYTIQTHGDCDMVVALLGPDDYTKQILYVHILFVLLIKMMQIQINGSIEILNKRD